MQRIASTDDIRRGLAELGKADPSLRPVIASAGEVPLRLSSPDFAGLVGIVISQQVSKASADAIHGRLRALVDPLEPETLLAADDEIMRAAGLSRPKQRTLRNAAEAIVAGDLDLAVLCGLDPDHAMEQMTAIKGVGPWTAEVYLLFCAGHADIFPAGDLALAEAVRAAHGLDERPADKQLREIAARWSPWRGVAARLFWAYYREMKQGRDAMLL